MVAYGHPPVPVYHQMCMQMKRAQLLLHRQWVNDPASARRTAELLTRDADDPMLSSGASPQPPPAPMLELFQGEPVPAPVAGGL